MSACLFARKCSCDNVERILKIKHSIKSRSTDVNPLALPSKRHAFGTWRDSNNVMPPDMIEHLKGIVHGEYMGVNVNNCKRAATKKKSPKKCKCPSKPKPKDPVRGKCCQGKGSDGKNSCSLVSSLLKKINTYDMKRETSMTCIIYNELCCVMGVDVSKTKDPKQKTLIQMSKKLSIWIKEMLEKKGSIECDEAAFAEADDTDFKHELLDGLCNQKKVPPKVQKKVQRKPKIIKTVTEKPKPKQEKPKPKPKAKAIPKPKAKAKPKPKPKKEVIEGPKVEEPPPAPPSKPPPPPEPKKAEHKPEPIEPKIVDPLIAYPAKGGDKPKECLLKDDKSPLKDDVCLLKDLKCLPKDDPCKKVSLDKKELACGKEGIGFDADKGECKKPKGPKLCVSSKLQKCRSAAPAPAGQCCYDPTFNEMNMIDAIIPKNASFSPNEIGKFKECAKILHCFSITLEVWNQWFYDIVEEAQRKILAKAGHQSDILTRVDNDWSNLKKKLVSESQQWKYYNQFAQKLVSNMEHRCSCDPSQDNIRNVKPICPSLHYQ